jgi:hypothetical protein
MNQRYSLTGHRAWLQQTPEGQHTVIAVHDGPGGDEFLGKLATSEHEFDAWFRALAVVLNVATGSAGLPFGQPSSLPSDVPDGPVRQSYAHLRPCTQSPSEVGVLVQRRWLHKKSGAVL